jgi:hypothetical protein
MRITCRFIERQLPDDTAYLILHCERNVLGAELQELAALKGNFMANLEALLTGRLSLRTPETYPEGPISVTFEGADLTLVADWIQVARCSRGIDIVRLFVRDPGIDLSWAIGRDLHLEPLGVME